MNIDQQRVCDVRTRIVAIVQFGPPTDSDGLRAGQYYQVTVDPDRFSPCGGYVRFGTYPGDEIVGWQRADRLFVVSELATWPAERETLELLWGRSPALGVSH